jgi:glycosyltransferase involved in cell wall biosynthesis
MRLLCDHQIFSSFRYSGISRYFCELFTEFNTLGVDWKVSCYFSNSAFLEELTPVRRFLPDMEFRGKNRILENINLVCTRRALAKGEFDIFHSTYSKPYLPKYTRGKPYVITVQDLTHEKFPELPTAAREAAEEKLSIKYADRIITPSKSTADDLIYLYPEAAEKVRVILDGVRVPEKLEAVPGLPEKFILHVGTRAFYRNFATAARAAARIKGVSLVCVGGGAFTAGEKELFNSLGISDRVLQYRLNENQLFYAYSKAAVLIFPSLAEGFGLPTVEAMSMGCVPVLSDIPCFREIGADGALYFEPMDDRQCAEQLCRVIEDSTLKEELVSRGRAGLHRFDWSNTAKQTLAVYQELL